MAALVHGPTGPLGPAHMGKRGPWQLAGSIRNHDHVTGGMRQIQNFSNNTTLNNKDI